MHSCPINVWMLKIYILGVYFNTMDEAPPFALLATDLFISPSTHEQFFHLNFLLQEIGSQMALLWTEQVGKSDKAFMAIKLTA